jgi:DNA polymerase III subunit epsilon
VALAFLPHEDLDVALYDTTFAVIDVETTGGGPDTGGLTELGAAKFRGGECLGTFATLVHPDGSIPPFVAELTGITDDMVLVGHNVDFDLAFLNAALENLERSPLTNPVVDTLILARRLVSPEVPNCRLATLAAAMELEHRPAHRALEDVMATADLLHRLIEDATGYGVFRLGQLIELGRVLPTVVRSSSGGLGALL